MSDNSANLRSVSLSETWASRVRGGLPAIEMAEFPTLDTAFQPGEAILLQSETGLVGAGLIDLENNLVRCLPMEGDEVFGADLFRRRLARALTHRGRLRLTGELAAYRLINNEGDDLSGFVIDVYARHAIIYTYTNDFTTYVDWLANALRDELKPHSIIAKVRPVGDPPTGRMPYKSYFGSEPPREVIVEENEARFEVHLIGGINTGLFLDMRDVRELLARYAGGKRVLNTFSYTGSLSLTCALGGAKSVTSVDFAAGNLDWERTNFELNELDLSEHQHKPVRSDVFDFLKQARRKEQQFDLVILDPPASTAVPGRRWFLKSDYDRLIMHALSVTSKGGMLVVCASSLQSRPEHLERDLKSACQKTGRRCRLLHQVGLPADFPTQMIYPQGRYLKCMFLLVD